MAEIAGKKKGLPVLAWVGIGCGALVLVGVIGFVALVGFGVSKAKDVVGDFQDNPAKAAAELVVRMNPDLELVSSDDAAGTMTIRNQKDGELLTLNFDDIAEGRFSVTTDEGEFSIDGSDASSGGVTVRGPDGESRFGAAADVDDVPDWVPVYPEASDAKSSYSGRSGGETTGAISATTTRTLEQVVDWYKSRLEDEGYEVTTQTLGSGDAGFATVAGERASDERKVSVMINRDANGPNRLTITYQGRVD